MYHSARAPFSPEKMKIASQFQLVSLWETREITFKHAQYQPEALKMLNIV